MSTRTIISPMKKTEKQCYTLPYSGIIPMALSGQVITVGDELNKAGWNETKGHDWVDFVANHIWPWMDDNNITPHAHASEHVWRCKVVFRCPSEALLCYLLFKERTLVYVT